MPHQLRGTANPFVHFLDPKSKQQQATAARSWQSRGNNTFRQEEELPEYVHCFNSLDCPSDAGCTALLMARMAASRQTAARSAPEYPWQPFAMLARLTSGRKGRPLACNLKMSSLSCVEEPHVTQQSRGIDILWVLDCSQTHTPIRSWPSPR